MKPVFKQLTFAIVLLTAGVAVAEQSGRPQDLTLANFQFEPRNRWAFSHIREVLPTANIPHDDRRVLALERSTNALDTFAVNFRGQQRQLEEIARDQFIDGILVLKDGKIITERYFGELRPDQPHLMMSVSKSVVGLLAGKLAQQGTVDLGKSVSSYVPALASGGWGPDSLRTLLDMRDGADFTEDYEDMSSTVRLMDCALGWTLADKCPKDGPKGGYAFFSSIGRKESNYGKFVYKSGSTDVIGWVLESAAKEPLAQLISKHIWQPMGAEHDAYITIDEAGFALADGGMNATLRDLGRLGLLVLNNGKAFGEQVVPEAFIRDMQMQPPDPNWPYAVDQEGRKPYYRSFWWGLGNGEGDITGLGIHGQYLHVAPEAGIVIAIFSSWPRADVSEPTYGWNSTYDLAAALIKKFR